MPMPTMLRASGFGVSGFGSAKDFYISGLVSMEELQIAPLGAALRGSTLRANFGCGFDGRLLGGLRTKRIETKRRPANLGVPRKDTLVR